MLWRLLWSLSRGVRPFGGGAGLSRPRLVAPAQAPEGEPARPENRHQERKAGGYGNLSHVYSPLDAFTLSTLAVLTLELVKQVRQLSSVQPGRRDAGVRKLEGPFAVLPQHQHSAPTTPPSCSSGQEEQEVFIGVGSGCELKNPPSNKRSQPKEYQLPSNTGSFFFASSTDLEPDLCQLHLQGNVAEVSVNEAASQMEQVIQTSISMAFNILGLQYMQEGQHKMAFSCFKLAADKNYSKAQFNVAVCYEHGRGTKKDITKAVLYYQRAALQGHALAQYHYARWLVCNCPSRDSNGNIKKPVDLLSQIATPRLTQNSLRRHHLDVRNENDLGIHRRRQQQADSTSCKAAQKRMKVTVQEEIAGMERWRPLVQAVGTFSSSPCLQDLGQPVFDVLRSWSTGNLRDGASGYINCMHSPVFSDGLTLKLPSLAWSPGAIIS
ncbi:death ligand signal enhancer isoform X2 [Anolis carolinensis]|uniref:death ligand signal enhancer isoform X2 n=1 Tax=Anolis carolinensis TaxID=28377 RepID=UPI000462AC63